MQADKAGTQQRVQFRAASCRCHLVWVERVRALHWVFSVYRPTGSSGGAETEKPVRQLDQDTIAKAPYAKQRQLTEFEPG